MPRKRKLASEQSLTDLEQASVNGSSSSAIGSNCESIRNRSPRMSCARAALAAWTRNASLLIPRRESIVSRPPGTSIRRHSTAPRKDETSNRWHSTKCERCSSFQRPTNPSRGREDDPTRIARPRPRRSRARRGRADPGPGSNGPRPSRRGSGGEHPRRRGLDQRPPAAPVQRAFTSATV